MDDRQLREILAKHRDWVYGKKGGERADLTGADLTRSDLYGADLKKTILEGINWLAYLGVVPDHQGTARAYKVLTNAGVGPFNGGINYLEGDVFESELDPDVNAQCSQGIHLATFRWCLDNKQEGRRLFMFSFNVKDCVCPIGSDGKFRVRKCRKIGECDWQGNLLK